MVLGNSSSHRGNLSLQKSLDLANLYLKNARESTDAEIIMVLCHDTKDTLSQAKKVARKTGDKSMNALLATTHIDLGDLLDRQGQPEEAMAFRKKAEKWG
jgi:3-keto-L-gulonate-6-phosphate decarboxylase